MSNKSDNLELLLEESVMEISSDSKSDSDTGHPTNKVKLKYPPLLTLIAC